MLGFLVDIIFVVFGHKVFQQSVEIHMGTNCIPLLADLILYSHEAEFVQKLLRDHNKENSPCSSTIHSDISMVFYKSSIIIFTITCMSTSYIPMDSK
jgi:hypothetical protein